MDRFDAMAAFVAVYEAESLTGAAKRLGLSLSVLSRQISSLEGRLGARLFYRTTRSTSDASIFCGICWGQLMSQASTSNRIACSGFA